MEYKLLGFCQKGAVRRFSFQRTEIGAKPLPFAVLVDVALAQKLKLPLQQLPSLCSRLLYASGEHELAKVVTLTESAMTIYASENATLAADAAKSASSARARKQAILNAAAPSGTLDRCARAAIDAIGRERQTTPAEPLNTESISHLRFRLRVAFKRFAEGDAKVRSMQLSQPDDVDSALLLLTDAERDYLGVRHEYAERLGFPSPRRL